MASRVEVTDVAVWGRSLSVSSTVQMSDNSWRNGEQVVLLPLLRCSLIGVGVREVVTLRWTLKTPKHEIK